MTIISRPPSDDVFKYFDTYHPDDQKSPHFSGNSWGRLHLEKADRISSKNWTLCALTNEEVLSIALPYHRAEGSDTLLIPERGLRLEDAIKSFSKKIATADFAETACARKMAYWKSKPFSPVFLSTHPAFEGIRSRIQIDLGELFHLDGLHRMIAWGLDGRYNSRNPKSTETFTAFIAGRKY